MGNFFEDIFFGKEPDDQNPISLLTGPQGELSDALNKFLLKNLETRPELFPGRITPEVPDFLQESFDEFTSNRFGDEINAATSDLISGEAAFEFDPAKTTSEWQKIYATPIMQMYQDVVLPMVRESFNVPGVAFSRERAEGELKATSDFFTQNVQPKLFEALQAGEQRSFESLENAASRRQGALNIPATRFQNEASAVNEFLALQQPELSAAYAEFLRTQPGTEPFLNLALQASSAVTSALPGFKPREDPIVSPGDVVTLAAALSDIKMKENIVPLESALDKVSKLKAYKFNYIDKVESNGETTVGIMAQDLEAVLPEAVTVIDGMKHIKVPAVLALLIDAVNELRKEL